MKLLTRTILLLALIILVSSLQLTSAKDKYQAKSQKSAHRRPYYGKHYRVHRSEEYVQKVKEDNLKKIQQFNNNNKKRLRAGPGGGSTGGNSFVMGETKFIEFTEEQFIKLFTGYKAPESHAHHQTASKESVHSQQNDSQSHNQNSAQKIFTRHFLGKVDPNHIKEIQTHYEKTLTQNSPSQESQQHNAWQDWQFDDPWQIDDHYLSSIYGDVNDDQNWGWDWSSWDNNYYNDFSSDYDHYWNDWQSDHWSTDDSDGWWSDWYEEEEGNEDNQNWWDDDGWGDDGWGDEGITDEDINTNDDNGKKPAPPAPSPSPAPGSRAISAYPDSAVEVNWILKQATTHVKEQGECGSCWSFSTIGIVESYFLIMGQGKMDLSEQQLVDCQKSGSYGCDGGWPHNALDFASASGLVAQEKYPYRGVQQKCAHPTGPHKIPKSTHVTGRSAIQSALRKGPVSAALYVDDGFQFYKQGIFDKCIKEQANHAIIIVGFTKDYWIVRNSWGADWGESGHIRIKKEQNNKNACSIQDYVIAINY